MVLGALKQQLRLLLFAGTRRRREREHGSPAGPRRRAGGEVPDLECDGIRRQALRELVHALEALLRLRAAGGSTEAAQGKCASGGGGSTSASSLRLWAEIAVSFMMVSIHASASEMRSSSSSAFTPIAKPAARFWRATRGKKNIQSRARAVITPPVWGEVRSVATPDRLYVAAPARVAGKAPPRMDQGRACAGRPPPRRAATAPARAWAPLPGARVPRTVSFLHDVCGRSRH